MMPAREDENASGRSRRRWTGRIYLAGCLRRTALIEDEALKRARTPFPINRLMRTSRRRSLIFPAPLPSHPLSHIRGKTSIGAGCRPFTRVIHASLRFSGSRVRFEKRCALFRYGTEWTIFRRTAGCPDRLNPCKSWKDGDPPQRFTIAARSANVSRLWSRRSFAPGAQSRLPVEGCVRNYRRISVGYRHSFRNPMGDVFRFSCRYIWIMP